MNLVLTRRRKGDQNPENLADVICTCPLMKQEGGRKNEYAEQEAVGRRSRWRGRRAEGELAPDDDGNLDGLREAEMKRRFHSTVGMGRGIWSMENGKQAAYPNAYDLKGGQ